MLLNVDVDLLRRTSESIAKACDETRVSLDNISWGFDDLSLAECLMIEDEKKDYSRKLLGLDANQYSRYLTISDLYTRLEHFYDEEAENIKREREIGFDRLDVEFDPNLTKEQAYEKYAQCDRDTALKIHTLVSDVETKVTFHIKDVRESYTGDLATQLGRDKELYERRASELSEELDRVFTSIKNSDWFRHYSAVIPKALEGFSSIAERYSNENQEQATPLDGAKPHM